MFGAMNSSEMETGAEGTLKKVLLKRIQQNPSYSLRAFGRDIHVSHNYLSQIFSGKRNLSVEKASEICAALKLSKEDTESFITKSIRGRLEAGKHGSETPNVRVSQNGQPDLSMEIDRFKCISEWYHGAILELMRTESFKSSPSFIARKLGLPLHEVKTALNRLRRMGLVTEGEVGWIPTERHVFFSTQQVDLAVQKFHKDMMVKATSALDDRTAEAFGRRDVTGITFAINAANISQAKREIARFRKRMMKILSKGKRTEVYQLNVQLFALTAPKRKIK